MAIDSPFGGFAGETVRRFTAFSTLLTLLPALILTAALGWAAQWLSRVLHLPLLPSFLTSIILTSPVLGKFALSARQGNLDSGFFASWNAVELSRFVARYALLTLAWGLPLSLAGHLLFASAGASALLLGSISSARGAMLALGLFVMAVIATLSPSLTLIVATRSESISQCFSGETWRWLLGRQRDLPAFYAALIGGAVVFAVFTLPLLLVITALGFWIRMEAGLALAALNYLLPLMAVTVLLGKLAGAFVMSDGTPDSTVSPATAQSPDSTEPALDAAPLRPEPTAPFARPPIAKPAGTDLARALKQLAATADAELPTAIEEAKILRRQAPRHAGLLAELAKLYLRNGQSAEAIATASEAMSQALSSGASPVALACYGAFSAHRKNLTLKAPELEQLARQLLSQHKFADAAWSFSTCAKLGGDPNRVHKGMIAIAEAASKAGQFPAAARIYEYVIQSSPSSANAEYCQTALARVKSKLKKPTV